MYFFTTMNRHFYIVMYLVAMLLSASACRGDSAKSADDEVKVKSVTTKEVAPKPRTISPVKNYGYRIVKEYPHSSHSYTQGLTYVDGVMWEGTGQVGRSHLQRLNLPTGEVDIVATLGEDEFGEGIAIFGERIYQLTWYNEYAYVYDMDGTLRHKIPYRGEGWGITTDSKSLYMSDGSSIIKRINPETFRVEERIEVTYNGQPLDMLNELEWIDGKIWANVYLTYSIVIIDPTTGVIEAVVDMPDLRHRVDNPEAEAFNGVAYNPQSGHIYVTGKDWNKLFEIEIIK